MSRCASRAVFTLCALAAVAPARAGDSTELRPLGIDLVRSMAAPGSEKPAELSYTRPGEGQATAVVNAGILGSLGIARVSFISEVRAGVSFHRNTALAHPQNTVLVGAGAEGLVGERLFFVASLDYKNDRIAGSRGGVASFVVYPRVGSFLNQKWEPSSTSQVRTESVLGIGIQHERVSSSDADSAAALRGAGLESTGSATRWHVDAGLAIKLPMKLRLDGFYLYWRDQQRDGPFAHDERSRSYRTVGLSLPLDAKEDFNLSLSRVEGTNPVEGIFRARYTQLGLTARYDFLGR